MRLLAEAGIDVLSCNKRKVNALHVAVKNDHRHIVDMLLESDFPFQLETEDGMTPLMLAAYYGRAEITERFIQHLEENVSRQERLDYINKVNDKNENRPMGALSLAILQDHQKVGITLIEAGARTYYNTTPKEKDLSPIFIAVQK